MKALFRSTLREIKNSFGRYMAILIIIALGVGFFAGLRACRPALTDTVGKYFGQQNFYDYRCLSSLGFSPDCADGLTGDASVTAAEGAISKDALIRLDGNDAAVRFHSIQEKINLPRLVSGRMPEADNECLADADIFGEDMLGKTVVLSEKNSAETADAFAYPELVIVGTAASPLYINADRGSTSLGDGRIAAFILVNEGCFTADHYTELYITLEAPGAVYSDEYKSAVSQSKSAVTVLAEKQARLRFERIVADAQSEVDDARAELDSAKSDLDERKSAAVKEAEAQLAAMGLPVTPDAPYYVQALAGIDKAFADAEKELAAHYEELDEAQREVDGIAAPSVYVTSRAENAGYAAFEQDSIIIENISVVFPAFFFLVAVLVCATTMKRMVEEERTQIGVLKALGYGKGKICFKYLFYAGSAGLLGSVIGFFAGTEFMPMIFWRVYSSSYNFTDMLLYSFSPAMYAVSLVISILCTAGVTFLCCRSALREVPAGILRPKTPKGGKRIFIERLRVWRRVSFLHKVSIRNVIRYKQRFFLMILGISGCTALLLTGFGIRDSVQNVTEYQYGEIVRYDGEITFTDPMDGEARRAFLAGHEDIGDALFSSVCNADITAGGSAKSVSVTAVSGGDLAEFIDLKMDGETLSYPDDGEIVLCRGVAEAISAKAGDTVTLTYDNFYRIDVTVSGVFDNYIGNYLFVTEETMTRLCGSAPINTAYFRFAQTAKADTAALYGDEAVGYVSMNSDTRETIEDSFASLNLVLLLIILCAGMLAFIVLFDLININIGERIREIATIKVLGFFSPEVSAYVFREVNMLTVSGALLGLPFGKLLHIFVMQQVRPDGICFDSRIMWYSYLLSFALTLVFSAFVQIVMRVRLKKISMVGSLKAVE